MPPSRRRSPAAPALALAAFAVAASSSAGGRVRQGDLQLEGTRFEDGSQHAFVALEAEHPSVFVGERVELRVVFGLEAGFFDEQAISLFRQPLELPVQVLAEWTEGVDGAVVSPFADADGSARPRFALGTHIVAAQPLGERTLNDRRYRVFERRVPLRPERPGALALDRPRLRFAYASEFEDDVFAGRVPRDRHDAEVVGASLVLDVMALPEAGRPPEFFGVVGRFAVEASVEPSVLSPGDDLALVLRFEGDGDPSALEAPRLDGMDGFRVRGVVEREASGARVFVYDLEPRAPGVAAVPALALPAFDPTPPGAWVTLSTAPVPLTWRAVASTSNAASLPLDESDDRPLRPPRWGLPIGLSMALVALVFVLALARRRRG